MVQLPIDFIQNIVDLFFSGSLKKSLDFSASVVIRSEIEHSPLYQLKSDHFTQHLSLVEASHARQAILTQRFPALHF